MLYSILIILILLFQILTIPEDLLSPSFRSPILVIQAFITLTPVAANILVQYKGL